MTARDNNVTDIMSVTGFSRSVVLNSVTVNTGDQRWRTKQSETSTRDFVGKITVTTYMCRYGPVSIDLSEVVSQTP